MFGYINVIEKLVIIEIVKLDGALSRSPVTKFFTNKKFGCISLWISKVHAWNFVSPSFFLFMFVRKKINPKSIKPQNYGTFFFLYYHLHLYIFLMCRSESSDAIFFFPLWICMLRFIFILDDRSRCVSLDSLLIWIGIVPKSSFMLRSKNCKVGKKGFDTMGSLNLQFF